MRLAQPLAHEETGKVYKILVGNPLNYRPLGEYKAILNMEVKIGMDPQPSLENKHHLSLLPHAASLELNNLYLR
jgi:hypothetical protein